MAQTNLNVRIDENLKKQFDAFCDELGLSMSVAINIFVKKGIYKFFYFIIFFTIYIYNSTHIKTSNIII